MRINTNIAALTAQEANTNTNLALNESLEKLSTGLAINKASDDASGLSIADKLRTQASSISQGIDNGNSAVALLQIADKSMAEQSTILDIIKAKLIQANTDTTSVDGQVAIAKDVVKLLDQVNNIALQTNYNGNYLLASGDGSDKSQRPTPPIVPPTAGSDVGLHSGGSLIFQIGEKATDTISTSAIASFIGATTLQINSVVPPTTAADITGLGLGDFHHRARLLAEQAPPYIDLAGSPLGDWNGTINVTSAPIVGAPAFPDIPVNAAAIANKILSQETVDTAITTLNGYRANAGSSQSQVESAVRNLMTQVTNIKAAESIIRDVDYAAESANFNKFNIIAQAGTYAISQANQVQQNVLRLLQ